MHFTASDFAAVSAALSAAAAIGVLIVASKSAKVADRQSSATRDAAAAAKDSALAAQRLERIEIARARACTVVHVAAGGRG